MNFKLLKFQLETKKATIINFIINLHFSVYFSCKLVINFRLFYKLFSVLNEITYFCWHIYDLVFFLFFFCLLCFNFVSDDTHQLSNGNVYFIRADVWICAKWDKKNVWEIMIMFSFGAVKVEKVVIYKIEMIRKKNVFRLKIERNCQGILRFNTIQLCGFDHLFEIKLVCTLLWSNFCYFIFRPISIQMCNLIDQN